MRNGSVAVIALLAVLVGCKGEAPVPAQKKEPALSPAQIAQKCKVFEPPWGDGSWIEWGQKNPEAGEQWYNTIEDTMKHADLTVLPRCTHLTNVFLGFSGITDLGAVAKLRGVRRLDLRFNGKLEDLSPLAGLPALEYLNITGTGVKDLAPVATLPVLAELEARMLPASDVGPLAKAANLEKVDLLKCPVEDLRPLAAAPKLSRILVCTTKVKDVTPLLPVKDRIRALDLCATGFSDWALLGQFSNLEMLRLSGLPIADLAPLAGLTKLTKLDINGTKITSLAPVKDMVGMREMDLSDTVIGDLSPLYSMKQLARIYLINAKIDPAQIASLKQALPGLEVVEKDGI
jgi:internalin A